MARVLLSELVVLGYSAQIFEAQDPETADTVDIRYQSPTGHSWWEESVELPTAQYMAAIAMVKAALLVTPMISWAVATDPEPKGDQVCWILNSRATALVLAGEELPPATNFLFLVDGGRIDYHEADGVILLDPAKAYRSPPVANRLFLVDDSSSRLASEALSGFYKN